MARADRNHTAGASEDTVSPYKRVPNAFAPSASSKFSEAAGVAAGADAHTHASSLTAMLRRPLSAVARRCALRRSALGQQRRVMATAPEGQEEQWTDFGKRFTADSGINRLMGDIALATAPGAPPVLMMGGGNPAQIPEVKEALRETMLKMLHDEPGEQNSPLLHAVSNYDGPPGGRGLVHAVAEHFSEKFGWDIGPENVALTNGSQSSFVYLFNACNHTGTPHHGLISGGISER